MTTSTYPFAEAVRDLELAITIVLNQQLYSDRVDPTTSRVEMWQSFLAEQPTEHQEEMQQVIARVAQPSTSDEAEIAAHLLADIGQTVPEWAGLPPTKEQTP